MNAQLNAQAKREYAEWLALCERIKSATPLPTDESEAQKRARIARLRENFTDFCRYYFPDYMDSDFGWFHKKAADIITIDRKCFAVLEWPREHAKSVFADVFMPLFLYARGELTGVLIASANETKAAGLLGDLQAQFTANERLLHDYGNRASFGDWRDNHFATTDGCGFWAFGRGQSPRGVRKAAKRPNYAVVDDIDDKAIVKNEQRVREVVDWIIEDLFGACSVKGARLIVAGNRINKRSILAHIVGDTDPEQPKREGIQHIKVFALENKARKKDLSGQPAWKERYSIEDIRNKMKLMGMRSSLREYFHEHIEEGNVFKHEWIEWASCPRNLHDYETIEIYCDPSFKGSKDNDYKAIVAVGKAKAGARHPYYIIKVWLRQASVAAMVKTFYDFFGRFEQFARYRMEANFIQDLLLKDFDAEAAVQGFHIPLSPDKRDKPDKITRVENLSPLFERGLVAFNEDERSSPDMQTLIEQLLAFPTGHDDGPDAVEGAIYYLNRAESRSKFTPRLGKFRTNGARRF